MASSSTSSPGNRESLRLTMLLPGWRPHGYFGERIFAIRPWAPRVPRAVQCFVEHLREALAGGFGVAAR